MSNTSNFPLSGEDRKLLGDNGDFFQSIVDVFEKIKKEDKVELYLDGSSPENKIEKTVLPNGDTEITFVFGLDTNDKPEDGRLFIRDKFIFDDKERLKDFKRGYEHNGQGDKQAWEKWKAAYETHNPKPAQDRLIKFASLMARRYLSSAHWRSFSPGMIEGLKSQSEYLMKGVQPVLKLDEKLEVRFVDPQSHYSLDYQGDKVVLTLSFVIDNDEDPANRRFYWNEKITFDYKTREFEKIERQFSVAPESQDQPGLADQAKQLTEALQPSPLEGKAFYEVLRPKLPLLDPALFDKTLEKGSKTFEILPGYASMAERVSRRQSKLDLVRHDATRGGLQVLEQVALEDLQKRSDESRGLITRFTSAQVNLGEQQALIKSVFEKAAAKLQTTQGKSPFAVLNSLELSDPERALVGRLQDFRLGQEVNAIAQEYDEKIRAFQYARFAREHLMLDAGLTNSALYVATKIKDNPVAQQAAAELFSLAEGKASAGTKVTFLGNHMLDEISSPAMLGAMFIAPFAGGTLEAGVLRLIGGAGKNPVGRFIAAQVGLGFESAAFSLGHRFLASTTVDPSQAWKGFGMGEIGTAYLMFNGARLAHWTAGVAMKNFTQRPWLGQDWAALPQYSAMPGGRWITSWGPGARELSRSGRALEFMFEHGTGVSAMFTADALAQQLHWKEGSKQGKLGDFFDVGAMYISATLGNHLGNRASGGKFQEALGRFRLGLDLASKTPVAPASAAEGPKPPSAEPPVVEPPPSPRTPPPLPPAPAPALPFATTVGLGGKPKKGPPPMPGAKAASSTLASAGVKTDRPMFPASDGGSAPGSESTRIRPVTDIEVEGGLEVATRPHLEILPEPEMLPYQFSFAGFEGRVLDLELAANTQRILFGRNMNEPSGLKVLGELLQINVSREHPTVSEFHAEIIKGPDGAWYFGDNGSAYGSRINGDLLIPGTARALSAGDSVKLGDSLEFIFSIEGKASPEFDALLNAQTEAFKRFGNPRPGDTAPVVVQVYPLQNKPAPPEPALEFPFETVFPGFKARAHADSTAGAKSGTGLSKDYVVAYLRDSEGKALRKFSSDQTSWPFFISGPRGKVAIGQLSVDARGQWIWQNLVGERGATINGQVTHQWDFVGDGSVFDWGEGPMRFGVPKQKQKPAGEETTVARAVEPPPELEAPLDPASDLEGGDKTLTNIPVLQVPMLISPLPHALLRGLPEGKGPVNLRVITKGVIHEMTDPKAHTYFIKDAASGGLEVSTAATNDHYGFILYGQLGNERAWWLVTSGGYEASLNGRGVTHYRGEKLRFGDVIDFKDSKGREALRMVFDKPTAVAERLKTEGMPVYAPSPVDIQGILKDAPVAAPKFPREIYRDVKSAGPMSLRIGPKRESADWHTTHYVLGSAPDSRAVSESARAFPISGSSKVAENHAVVYVGPKGEWWLLDLGSAHGSYLNNTRLKPGEAKMLAAGDKIGLGGVETDSPFGADAPRTVHFEMSKEAQEAKDSQPPTRPAKPGEAAPESGEPVSDTDILSERPENDFSDMLSEPPPDSDPNAGDRETFTGQVPAELLAELRGEPARKTIPPPPPAGPPSSEGEVVTKVGPAKLPPDAYPTGVHPVPQPPADVHGAVTARPPAALELAPELAVASPSPARARMASQPDLASPPPPPKLPAHMRGGAAKPGPTAAAPKPATPGDSPVSSVSRAIEGLEAESSAVPTRRKPDKAPVFTEAEGRSIKTSFARYMLAALKEHTQFNSDPSKALVPGMTRTAKVELDLGKITGLFEYQGRIIEVRMLGQVTEGHIAWGTDAIKSKPTEEDGRDPRYQLILQQVHELGKTPLQLEIAAAPAAPPKPATKTLISGDEPAEVGTPFVPLVVPAASDQAVPTPLMPPVAPVLAAAPPPAPKGGIPMHKMGIVNELRLLFSPEASQFEANLAALDRLPRFGEVKHRGDPADPMDFFYQFDELPGYDTLLDMAGRYHGRLKKNYNLVSDGQGIHLTHRSLQDSPPNTLALVALKPGSETEVYQAVFSKLLAQDVPLAVTLPLQVDAPAASCLGINYRASDASAVHAILRGLAAEHPGILEGSIPFSSHIKDAQGQAINAIGLLEISPTASVETQRAEQKQLLLQAFQTTSQGHPDGKFNVGMLIQAARDQFQEAGFSAVFPGFSSEAVVGSHKPVVDDIGM